MTEWLPILGKATLETLYMTLVSSVFAYALGLPLGVLLLMTAPDGLRPAPRLSAALGVIVNLLRSLPFIILLMAIQPVTRLIVGTTIGPSAAIVTLVLAAFPFVGRLVESSLREVDGGVVEAARSMGVSTLGVVWHVMLPESLPSLVSGAATATVSLLGYSAMAGVIGGGGLGDLAMRYGYHRREYAVLLATVALLVIVVQAIQLLGTTLARRVDRRRARGRRKRL